nr:sigma 54-interacting transcriptional regulator [uncultured Desulfobacter sp.]
MLSFDIFHLPLPAVTADTLLRSTKTNPLFDNLFEQAASRDNTQKTLLSLADTATQGTESISITISGRQFLAMAFACTGKHIFLILLLDSQSLSAGVGNMSFFKEIKENFQQIIGAVHDDFVMIDSKGIITMALPDFEKYYGIPREQAIGKSIFEMEEQGIFNPSVAIRVLKSGKTETMLQYTGADKYLMCTALPVKDKDGALLGIASYTTDITKYTKLKEEYDRLKETLKLYTKELEELRSPRDVDQGIISKDKHMQDIISTIKRIAGFDTNVLFLGKSGVGKTMYAKLMHSRSLRKNGPFIHINCGAIPENLLESELFGYEKGAFTGAQNKGKPGMIELANKGTLFLDEIADLPFNMQVKLLKVIQEKSLSRIGSTQEKQIDFRLITATNKDLTTMVKNNEFREDLYYRINIITLKIPGLAQRKPDIFPMVLHFLEQFNKKHQLKKNISNAAIDKLVEYPWPGNIRELQNTMERLVLSTDQYMITPADLPGVIHSHDMVPEQVPNQSLKQIMATVEQKIIQKAYLKHGTTTGVARALGISQPSASLKIKKYVKS